MSSMSAYFATVLRLTPSLLAISARGTPPASIDRISFITSRGTVISSILPGRARQSLRPGTPYGEGRAPGPGERGPRALSAQFSMTTMLKKRRPFGPLLSEHQHIIRQVNSGPLSGSPLDSCLRPTSQSNMSAQVRYAAGIDSGMVATSW